MFGKGKLSTIAFTALAIFAMGGTVFGTFAWFQASTHNDPYNLIGKSAGAYFAYGNGNDTNSENPRPYGIATARQLYNLAWLQYMGQFNKGDKEDEDPKKQGMQYYFELADSIPETGLDMTGYILPPIGTEDNPFVGNFNGNGKIIKNLTISNDESVLFSSTNPHPDTSQVTYTDETTPKIVGFFGVVGNLDGEYEGTYDSSVNSVYNLGLIDPKIQSQSQNTLVGVLAGYVDAEIENVAIENPTINVLNSNATSFDSEHMTGNISDYYVIGYCKDTEQKRYTKEVNKINDKIYKVNVTDSDPFSITEQGSTTGWGGSVDMKSMYDYLDADWITLNHGWTNNSTVDPIKYPTTRTMNYDINGNLISQVDGGLTSNDMPYRDYNTIDADPTNRNYKHKYFNVKKNKNLTNQDTGVSTLYETSSISYVVQTTGGNGYGREDEEIYMCLTGRKDITLNDKTLTITTNNYRDQAAKYIHYNDGNKEHYLSLSNNDASIDNTSTSQTTGWALVNGKLTTNSSTGATLYLACDYRGELSITNNDANASNWTYNETSHYFTTNVSSADRALTYDNGTWKCVTLTASSYRITDGNGKYLRHNGTNADTQLSGSTNYVGNANSTNLNWYLDNNYFRTTSDGDVYLKLLDVSTTQGCNTNHAYSIRATKNSTNGNNTYTYMTMNNNYISGGGYYLRLNGNQWTYTNNQNNATPLYLEAQFDNAPVVNFNGSTSIKVPNTSTNTTQPVLSIPHTYFPLRYDENMAPDKQNTGYVVSGGNYHGDPYGDIRVSSYGIDAYLVDIGSKQHDDEVDKDYRPINSVYTKTFDNNGNYSDTDVDANTFYASSDKYANSKKEMQYVLAEDSSAFGLHFMNATISMSNPAVAEGAVINGSNYYNLELPTDCVDFNLKEKGKINFFAGSYFQNNNSFFSLYEIEREKPASTSTDGTVTLTYDGLDSSLKMKFTYDNDPFAVAGHTFDHITINDNLLNGEGGPYDITNTHSGNYFVLGKNSKKYERFNLKFYDDVDQPYLEFNVSTLANKLKEIRKIKKVYADPTDTADERSYCYEYDINGNTKYSVPYYYSMGKKLKVGGTTPYVEGEVTNNKLDAYSQLVFNTDCIEVGPSSGTLKTLTRTSGYDEYEAGYVYYFEIPMNEGEFALGSVTGCNGAYLMYLDIAANASLIKRTTITEHFIYTEEKYVYPVGVAIVVDASAALTAANLESNPTPINPSKGITAILDSQFRGNINIDLAVIETTKTATLLRTNLPNAPNEYVAGNHASICYKSNDITSVVAGSISVDDDDDPETEPIIVNDQGSLEEIPSTTISKEIKRVNYYDFSAADGLTWTMIEEINGDTANRTVVQQINGSSISPANIKIYNEGGKKVTANNIDFSVLTFNTGDSNIILQFKYDSTDGSDVSMTITLNANVNAENYYEYAGYELLITNTGEKITVKVLTVGTGTITINGQTAVVDLEITIPTP